MSISECFPMRKRRYQNTGRTPKRSPCETDRTLRCTPRRISQSLNSSLAEQAGLEIIWDNESPSPGRVVKLGKRKKATGSDSSSGGEISDLVKKLAVQSGSTPEVNPLLKLWMCRDNEDKQEGNATRAIPKEKNKFFQTPARRPRRVLRRSNRAKVKQLTKELELLAHHIDEPEVESSADTIDLKRKSDTKGNQVVGIKTPTNKTEAENNEGTESLIPEEAELFDFWESDGSDDLVFSQVDISALCNGAIQETQVFTNTQTLGGKETVCNIFDSTLVTKESKASLEGSVVTEVWDFVEELGDSDSEDFLQTALEEFEKSQSVSAVKNKTPHKSSSLGFEKGTDLGAPRILIPTCTSNLTPDIGQCSKNSTKVNKSWVMEGNMFRKQDENLPRTKNVQHNGSYKMNITTDKKGVSELPTARTVRSVTAPVMLEKPTDKMTRREPKRNCGASVGDSGVTMPTNQWSCAVAGGMEGQEHSKPTQSKYSKEDIERKKMLAQQKRKQKQSQSRNFKNFR